MSRPIQIPRDHLVVVFGANGDLARRKLLPGFFHLFKEGLFPRRWALIGISRSEMGDEEFRAFTRDSIDQFCRCDATPEEWSDFASRLSYVSQEFRADDTGPLSRAIAEKERELGEVRRLFYLAVPPPAFGTITEALAAAELTDRSRVVYEKPFGVDRASFVELDKTVGRVLDDSQVFRIDHFLGKESLQNILALRFGNGMFEPVWNAKHIDHVQIDVPEEIGIGDRASFYEETGALRDMMVTHLFQVLSITAMEAPRSLEAEQLRDEKVRVFDAMRPLEAADLVRGQYEGYREAEGVAPDSKTETFVAAKMLVDNERWHNVPFFLRSGKRMAESRQTITLAFKTPPGELFGGIPARLSHNHLTIELGGEEGVSISFAAKAPGPELALAPAHIDFRYRSSFGPDLLGAYEPLIHDAMLGDRTLFTRPDGIERTWELVEGVLQGPPPLRSYRQGSWGPDAALSLIEPRRWHLPHTSHD
ncbi:MAG: glucose-6-phosphate dehydrogenase [Actinomycetota bacterium]